MKLWKIIGTRTRIIESYATAEVEAETQQEAVEKARWLCDDGDLSWGEEITAERAAVFTAEKLGPQQ